jgi:tetratricopeptide (TPR) repeat protein
MSQTLPQRKEPIAGVELGHRRERAAAFARMNRFEEALAAYRDIIARWPTDPEALNESGGLYMRLGRPHEAFACYDRAVAAAPQSAVLHINRGTALSALNFSPEALASFAAAAKLEPGRAEAHYNAALVHLRHGDFAAGWRGYEWRWRKADWAGRRRNFNAPLWLGEQSIDGKTILLHAEQGFGDTIQFVRYASLLAYRSAKVILECPPDLVVILRDMAGMSQVIERGAALPAFDFHCPLMSLPLAFGTELATIPATVPYLRPDGRHLLKWYARLPQNGRLRVGLCWAGSGKHLNNHNRSIPLASFAALLAVSGIDFVSVQKDVDPAQAAILREYGVLSLGPELADFTDTAAVLALLDLVVAVDTSVAHLAGAMGKVVALLLPFSPDWRWLLDRSDSPWYPTMRLFRQPSIGDWDEPLTRLSTELADVTRRSARPAIPQLFSERAEEVKRNPEREIEFTHSGSEPSEQAQQIAAANEASQLAEALAIHQAGRLADAERVYRNILAARPDHFDCLHLLGVILHQRGRHLEAIDQIDAALNIASDNTFALNNRGVVLTKLRRFKEALASFDRALAVQPHYAEALLNKGNALHEAERFVEALASYDQALVARPDYVEALSNRGSVLTKLKRFGEALASHDRALVLRPHYPEALSNRGTILNDLGLFEEAIASYDRALTQRPDYAEALCNRAAALHGLRRFEEALVGSDRALALRPDFAEAYANRGNALYGLKRFEEALASYDHALALQLDRAEVHTNRGNALHELKRFEEALASHVQALTLRPSFAEAHYNYGNALHALKRFEEALASYERALALRPDYVEALANQGVTLHEQKRFAEALASCDRALAVRPDFADAHYNAALSLLVVGDLERGWREYEWRWETEQLRDRKRSFSRPLWLGSNDIAGKTILLHAEQGFGDTIQFCRYVPRVTACGAHVIVEVQEPLRELISTLSGASRVISRGEQLPDFDVHCPLLSLPLSFGTRLATIPPETPYLRASANAVIKWGDRLGARRRPRIGLAWSGRETHKNDHNRSIRLRTLLPLLEFDATYVSLQRDVRVGDATLLQNRPDLLHFGDELKTFADTAALISNLDLIISVDTSVAHLAGAQAKPIWVLLPFVPEWRWLLDRQDSPWYATARLFRQDDTREWDGVICRVHAALRDHFDGYGPQLVD